MVCFCALFRIVGFVVYFVLVALLIAISTSGNSENILHALEEAKALGCQTLGFSGNDGGKMHQYCTVNLIVPSDNTPRIQEMHILFGHILCHTVDEAFSKTKGKK